LKTVFGSFVELEDARTTTRELLARGVDRDAVNALVEEEVAKDALEIDLGEAAVRTSDEIGERTAAGLDGLLGVERPVTVPGTGDVLAAGDLATVLVNTAAAAEDVGSLVEALEDFQVPRDAARAFAQQVEDGAVLLWVRLDDKRSDGVAAILRRQGAQTVSIV
jgi:hypothetical protein